MLDDLQPATPFETGIKTNLGFLHSQVKEVKIE